MTCSEKTTLLSLNEDVTRLVLENLETSDLRHLCLVHSGHLQYLAQATLYSSIDLTWRSGRGAGSTAAPPVTPWSHPLIPLLRTLLRRPELCDFIRFITYKKAERFQSRSRTQGWLVLPDQPLEEAVALVELTGLPYRDMWIRGLRKGSIDAYLAVLLTQLSHVRHLHLGPDVFIEGDILGLVLRSLLCGDDATRSDPRRSQASSENPGDSDAASAFPGARPGALLQLETVHLRRALDRFKCQVEGMAVQNTADILPLFYIESLRDINVSIDIPDDHPPPTLWSTITTGNIATPVPPPLHSPRCINLVSLTLYTLRESHLALLLSAMPRLRTFHWLWHWFIGSGPEHPYNTRTIDWDLIIPALEQVKDTLVELNIQAECTYSLPFDPFDPPVAIPLVLKGSGRRLATFERLEKLTLPLAFLTTSDKISPEHTITVAECLPPRLECLTLTITLYHLVRASVYIPWWTRRAGYYRSLIPWLENVPGRFTPRLRRLRLALSAPGTLDSGVDELDDTHSGVDELDDTDPRTLLAVDTIVWRLAVRAGIKEIVTLEKDPQFPETGWGG